MRVPINKVPDSMNREEQPPEQRWESTHNRSAISKKPLTTAISVLTFFNSLVFLGVWVKRFSLPTTVLPSQFATHSFSSSCLSTFALPTTVVARSMIAPACGNITTLWWVSGAFHNLAMAADGEYVRWVNSKEPGALMFVTTTTLGYTPVFRNPREKEHPSSLLTEACLLHGALLHAFCVMDHHLHLVIRSPMHMTMSKFMQSFKRHSATSFLKRVSPQDRQGLQAASHDHRAFWMRSSEGFPFVRSA